MQMPCPSARPSARLSHSHSAVSCENDASKDYDHLREGLQYQDFNDVQKFERGHPDRGDWMKWVGKMGKIAIFNQ